MKRPDTRRLASPRLQIQSVTPEFGDNYKPGFIGFTYTGSPFASRGITRLTRWSRLSDISATGVFVVTGENEGVEVGRQFHVAKVALEKYFDDPKTQVFFRKPKKHSAPLGLAIAATAVAQVGTRFDELLIAASLVEGSFLRRWLLSHFREGGRRFTAALREAEVGWLSAELAAYCLDAQSAYADRGCLAEPRCALTPQRLFEDAELFASWSEEPVEGPKSPGPQ